MAGETSRARLAGLGHGATIADLCAAEGLTRTDFDAWWSAECERRLPPLDGPAGLPVHAETRIARDARGVPHIFATSDHDAFVAYGYAMAQDRLFQMDLRRRRGAGRLAEVLGQGGLDADVLARTMDLPRLATAEFERLPDETRALFEAFAAGVNAAIQAAGAEALPIEFDLLAYEPEPWTALDCVLCVTAWRWQLTGRPWVIAVPELAKRTLGEGPLYEAFIAFMREADDQSIVPSGESTARDVGLTPLEAVAVLLPSPAAGAVGSSDGAGSGNRIAVGAGPTAFRADHAAGADPMGGSNNWLVAGSRSKSGKPIVASDPHMPYEAASSFYEVHLSSPSFECAGAGFVGYPGLTFGRNVHVAWAITNNICSQRDLYVERDPDAVIEERSERIDVRGREEPVTLTVQVTSNGPLVDHLLPAAAAPSGPVSMRWVGQLACDWPSAQLRLNRASTVDEALSGIRGWLSPTFSLLVADDFGEHGRIAFSNTGTIPVRGRAERGYRDALHPDDAWRGLIPPDGLPQTRDPARGWLGSANNRPILDADYPYPLSGTWDEGYRHRRISQLAEGLTPHDRSTFAQMHTDVHVGRFDERRAAFAAALAGRVDGIAAQALALVAAWNGDATVDSPAAAIWEVAWTRWVQAVAAARFPSESSDFVAAWMNGFAGRLLGGDDVRWFASDVIRTATLVGAFEEAVEELQTALGDDLSAWHWGRLQAKGLRHPLSAVGDLGVLLDQPARPAGGDIAVLNNVGFAGGRISPADPAYARNWEGTSGAGYRVVSDLGDPNASAWTVTLEGQSANAGSPNRSDQLDDFLGGRYHEVPLDRARAEAAAVHTLVAEPRGRHD